MFDESIINTLATKRLGIYVLPPLTITRRIQEKRSIIFNSKEILNDDTRNIIGGAALYPPHITIKGTFRVAGDNDVQKQSSLERLTNELQKLTNELLPFEVATRSIDNYPSNSLSIMFQGSSSERLRKLQTRVLNIVNLVRAVTIEPEFQLMAANEMTKKYGEPYVGDAFCPHITIVGGAPGGLSNKDQIEKVRKLLVGEWYENKRFVLDRLVLAYESKFGGCWEIADSFLFERSETSSPLNNKD
jgi:2'-5' RNA ligase